MKFKLSKSQWIAMGKKAGWDEGLDYLKNHGMFGTQNNKVQPEQLEIFQFNAKIRIFITKFDIEMHPNFDNIVKNPNTTSEEKIKQLKELSLTIAINNKSEKDIQFYQDDLSAESLIKSNIDFYDFLEK